jgi:HEAT repeat protein
MTDNLEFLLKQLAEEDRPVRLLSLAALSDLARSQTDVFRATWADLSTERRFELIGQLLEQAETNVRLNFWAILRTCLDDADARVRKLSVEGSWEDNRASLISLLITRLREDPAFEVRAAAANSLGRFVLLGELGEIDEEPARQAVDALQGVWFRPHEVTEVRRRALEGLAYTGVASVRELIRSAYYDEDEAMRQSAVFAMGRSADHRWAKQVLAELGSQDAAMRFEAATAAGELALPDAIKPLIELLDDVDGNVREVAALALGQIGGPESRRALEAAAAGDDERLAEAAKEALEELSLNSGSMGTPLFDFSARLDGEGALDGDADSEDGDLYDEDDETVEDVDLSEDDDFYTDDEDEDWYDEEDEEEIEDED